ncbi:TetR/AcrR family transcriptional regulator [Brevibacillus laterosporus]|uniref:TetR/AcrR family transcriptional regulator n=1 Tax=Brevibacillus laterosporus TaxID=1465 RepID=UPI002650CAA8|nr:TetR/AcrR family transcriptional regulator [Brevibacillus laterosporus]MDN9012019.1 TetR/AcrR family transcriptional regulator [Brevibacillus laterosporus]MDO0943115.1 TetR/AcrR family transcriptional regulator [Brevibacillus laterosporus]
MDKKKILFNCGRELFHSKGFKDTNIADIAKMAGIAVGTFYNYYSSKEKLFFEIYMKENKEFKKRIVESLDLSQDPVTLVRKIVEQNISSMSSNKILKEWYNRDFFRELEHHYEEVKEDDDSIRSLYTGLFRKWKAEGEIRDDIDDELLPAFFDSLAYIDTHKEEIGVHHFPQLIQYLAEFIMKGLTDFKK